MQSGSYARGVEMAGYSNRALTWGMSLLVLALLIGAFIWMANRGFGEPSRTNQVIAEENYTPVAE